MHPDLITWIVQQDIAERVRDVERERQADLARTDRGATIADRLGESLRRPLARWQALRGDHPMSARDDRTADTACP